MPSKRAISPAQRALQITFVLKGHLKNVQLAYLRVAKGLANIRDENLHRALGYDSLEDYAAARLNLQRSALYKYMQIHDWVQEFHPAWLAPKPTGFIPELSDAYALMWIERRLKSPRLNERLRRELISLRQKALAGKLTDAEFRKLREHGRGQAASLRSLLSALRAARRQATRVPGVPPEVISQLDAIIARIVAMLDTAKRVTVLSEFRRKRATVRE
jgi:hypothetical protein